MAVVEQASADATPDPAGGIEYRLNQQRLLARFGMEALRSRDVDRMLQRASELCATGMRARFCKYLDAPVDDGMCIHAGIGWEPGVVGIAKLGADLASPAGYAFKTGEAVISNHLEEEDRFRTPEVMARHGIRRAINVVVEANGTRYGVLEVDSPDEGQFDADDLSFMQGFANLIGVAIERQHAEARLAAAAEHQELLVREASHRLKNSLALVSAMLELQMREDDDPRVQRLLGDAQARISAIAQTHDQLWRGDRVGLVAIEDLACGLTATLEEQGPGNAVSCRSDAIELSADAAIPLGLILSELVTNAIKYSDDAAAAIDVAIRRKDDALVLTVRDRGQGLPEGFDADAASRSSLGMRMIRSLSRQLSAEFTIGSADPGTLARVVVPLPC